MLGRSGEGGVGPEPGAIYERRGACLIEDAIGGCGAGGSSAGVVHLVA